MKKHYIVLLSTLFIITLDSCKKDLASEENKETKTLARINDINRASYETQIAYTRENLRIITLEIAKLAQNTSFRDFVREEAAKKFDNEYEVLINDLMKNNTWSEALQNPNLQQALENFKNIGNNSYYPHVYIPKMQKREDDGLSNDEVLSKVKGENNNPIFVFSHSDGVGVDENHPDVLQGYRLNSNGDNLEEFQLVNEEFADENEVWVFALNESVDKNGIIYLMTDLGDLDPNNGGGGGSNSGLGSGPYVGDDKDDNYQSRVHYNNTVKNLPEKNCKITNMIVAMHKESWFSGASEVSIKAVLTAHNGRIDGERYPKTYLQYESDHEADRRGHLIRKFKRREIRNQETINVNYSMQTKWPAEDISAPVFFDFYVFEADDWPADKNTINTYHKDDFRYPPYSVQNPAFAFWQEVYRSQKRSSDPDWHTPYIQSSICNTAFLTRSSQEYYNTGRFVNVGAIGFNTVGY